jgi:hypothetical protein
MSRGYCIAPAQFMHYLQNKAAAWGRQGLHLGVANTGMQMSDEEGAHIAFCLCQSKVRDCPSGFAREG